MAAAVNVMVLLHERQGLLLHAGLAVRRGCYLVISCLNAQFQGVYTLYRMPPAGHVKSAWNSHFPAVRVGSLCCMLTAERSNELKRGKCQSPECLVPSGPCRLLFLQCHLTAIVHQDDEGCSQDSGFRLWIAWQQR